MGKGIAMEDSFSTRCVEVLKLLARSRNVLISGPPGTGKSKLLAEVALAFESGYGITPSGVPVHSLNGEIPIPPSTTGGGEGVPAPKKGDRKVFRTVFHQNSKYRDFLSGITPTVNITAVTPSFSIVKGTLYRASEHVKATTSNAALLIIDEINRGPAVQIFGGSIVSIESDKRLAEDGSIRSETQFFELLDPTTSEITEYALPHDLYLLAAMNQADASVEPLDVAFMRRWEPLQLNPDEQILRNFYKLGAKRREPLPDSPSNVNDALEASVKAWAKINEQISLGRGSEFQIGHGVLMNKPENLKLTGLSEVLESLCIGWAKNSRSY